MIKVLLFGALLMPFAALAQEAHEAAAEHGAAHGGEHAAAIPGSVLFQAINFLIFAALLVWLLRKPIREYFQSRQEHFKQALVKAEHARREAEQKRQEIADRLARLESTTGESVAQARAEAEALKAKILGEAQQLTTQLRDEAHRTAQLEIERAKNELRTEVLAQAVSLSTKMLHDKMAEGDQKRLQSEFVDKVQEVR